MAYERRNAIEDSGMKMSIKNKTNLGFGAALFILLVVGAVAYRSITDLVATFDWVTHSHILIAKLEQVSSALKDAEAGQRGYIITGEDVYLEPYTAALTTIERDVQDIRYLTADNPTQQRRIDRLEPLIAKKLAFASQTISVRREVEFQAAVHIVLTDQGRRLMDQIRDLISEMEHDEYALLALREAQAHATAQRTSAVIGLGGLLAFALVLLALGVVNRDIAKRKTAEGALRAAEAKYRTLAEQIPAVTYMADFGPSGVWSYVSPQIESLLGFSQTEWLADPERWHQQLHPDDREQVFAMEAHSRQSGEPFRCEYRMRAADGQDVWIRDEAVVWDTQDQPPFLQGFLLDITERKQAEQALREGEQRYRVLYAAAQRQAQDLSLLGQVRTALARELELGVMFRTVVEAIVDTFGYTQVSLYLLQEEALVLQHQVGYDRVLDRIPIGQGVSSRVVRTGRPILLKDVRTDPAFLGAIDGIVSEICIPLFDQEQVVGILNVESINGVTLSDDDLWLMIALGDHISIAIGRARLYTEARENESILRSFYDSAALMMGVVEVFDDDILHLSDNAASGAFFGRTPEMMRNQFASRMGVPLEALHMWLERYRASERSGHPVRFEYAHGAGADVRWLSATVHPIMHATGERPRCSYVVEDVTERKHAEAALRDSEERFRQFAENVDEVFWMVSPDLSRVIYISPAYERIWGRSCASVYEQPKSFLHSIHPDDSERVVAAQARKIDGEYDEEYRIIRPDNTVRWIWSRSFPISDADGTIYRIAGISVDITERKKVERLKNEFVSTVSHELRTPLTAIRGALSLLGGSAVGELTERAKIMIDIAYKNSDRLMRLINDILDIEKIEADRTDFRLRPIALALLLEQAIEANRPYGEQLGVTFRLEPTPLDMIVNVDPDRLIQVLTNLCSNAAKFSPAGTVVDISAARIGTSIRIAVADQGFGIPEAFRDRVFQKFAQADSSDTRKKGGTGLGLSISKALVEKLGGLISFETQVDTGTTFYVELPEWCPPGVVVSRSAR
jgi:PAS domain S-box-containing protein